MKNWKFWDWTAYAALGVAAFMTAADTALKNAPAVAKLFPGLAESNLWAFMPAVLVVVASAILIFRRDGTQAPRADEPRSAIARRQFSKQRFRPESEFAVLPLHFTVDLAAQIPSVEVSLYLVSYLPRPIQVTDIDLTLHIGGAPALEDITFRQKDWQIDPKEYEVVFCRRQLTNAERDALKPFKDGRVPSASFRLSAKATDGDKNFTYGPVSAMVIEGWINTPVKPEPEPPTSERDEDFRITTLPDGTVPLPEAARVLYEVARSKERYLATAAERLSGSDGRGGIAEGTPEGILNFMATYIGGKANIYGTRPPSEKKELILSDEAKRGTFESGALVLKARNVYTDLAVSKSDLYKIIGALEKSEV